MIPLCKMANSGGEGNEKNPFPQFRNRKGMKKKQSQTSGMKKKTFPKLGNRKGMKKFIPII